jgi:hypothetical protein
MGATSRQAVRARKRRFCVIVSDYLWLSAMLNLDANLDADERSDYRIADSGLIPTQRRRSAEKRKKNEQTIG